MRRRSGAQSPTRTVSVTAAEIAAMSFGAEVLVLSDGTPKVARLDDFD